MTLGAILFGALSHMTSTSPPQPVPFDAARWRFLAAESRVETHLGRPSLYLRDGIALVADTDFENGSIEFDLAFTGERGFMGGIWRFQGAGNYEEFYLRPHQSGNPDATQYSPVFNGLEGWQLYHGRRYSAPVVHHPNEWTHVKILFAGDRAEIYVGNGERPVLVVDALKRDAQPGAVGVSAGHFAAAHFSNFSFTVTDTPPLREHPAAPEPVPPGVIPSWWVSDVFAESALEGLTALGPEDLAARSWNRLPTERSGLANLARVHGLEPPKNTVFARRVLVSSREQVKRLDFGWSDRVRVYLNGRLLFYGNDTAGSRDYRFLGSIGFFDALYLPLRQGENELLLAVSEDAGGWGVQAKLADLAGLVFKD